MGILENIRNKPHETKVRMIWISAGVVVALMVLAWILVGQMKIDSDKTFMGTIIDRVGNPSKTFPRIFNK